MCEEKRREKREKWEREIEGVRTESQAWKMLNRERERKKKE